METSAKYKLNKEDLIKILRGAGIAVAGAFLAYMADFVIPNVDAGDWVWLIPTLQIFINSLRKWVAGPK